jgi:hypothetical protein
LVRSPSLNVGLARAENVRFSGPYEDRPENPVPLVRGEIRELNRDIPVTFHTTDDELAAQTLQPRFNAVLLGIFSGIALLLATVGPYAGSQRRRNLV